MLEMLRTARREGAKGGWRPPTALESLCILALEIFSPTQLAITSCRFRAKGPLDAVRVCAQHPTPNSSESCYLSPSVACRCRNLRTSWDVRSAGSLLKFA